jgi:hypothetical protein
VANELERLRDLGRELVDSDEESVRRARELLERRIDQARFDVDVTGDRVRRRRRFRLRSPRVVLVAAALLLVGSALSFGLASSLTPTGSAGVNFVGFGFRPVQGWNVLQTGTFDESGVARAVAANVQLGAGDDLGSLPRATLASLPDRGVLIFATFRPRGDPEQDARFEARELPLQLEDAQRLPTTEASFGDLAGYGLRAAVGGYNVEARLYFGSKEPSSAAFAAAQAQLNRLVVGAEKVTIRVQPTVIGARVGTTRVRVSGTVDGARAGEAVTFQAKTCGLRFFRVVGGAVTEADGSWWNYVYPSTLTTYRAVWRNETSAEVTVRVQAFVTIRRWSARTFEIRVGGNVWRKRVVIQRFDNRLGTWHAVRSVLLTDDTGTGAKSTFTLAVPKGTLIRAVVPRSLAAPCYLPNVSNRLRT